MTTTIAPHCAATIVLRNGSDITEHDALILATNMNQGLLGSKGEPSIEACFRNPTALQHVGTSSWQDSMLRVVSVVHVSHPDFVEGRASVAYKNTADDVFDPVADLIERGDNPPYFEAAARTAHEANRILCALMGDNSHETWNNTSERIKNSIRAGVRRIWENPGVTSEQQHQAWMEQMIADGWTFGPVRNPALQQNPGLKPWNELGADMKGKDYLFTSVTKAFFDLQQEVLPNQQAQQGAGSQIVNQATSASNLTDQTAGANGNQTESPAPSTNEVPSLTTA